MPYRILLILSIIPLLASCVSKAQYDTLTVERDYYRNQTAATDSTTAQMLQTIEDSLQQARMVRNRQLRKIEDLTGTNRSLHDRINDLTERYESIMEQNSSLIFARGNDGSLQQDLQDLQAELDRREATLDRRELQLQAREESLSSLDRMRNEQPEVYGSDMEPRGTSPVDPESAARVRIERLQEELRQLMLALTDTGYVLRRPDEITLELVLGGELTFEGNNNVSLAGQRILRRLAGTLRNYPGLSYTVIGHAESVDGDPLLAYQTSTERGISVALQLAQFGIDSGTIIAGGQGYYGPDDTPQLNGLDNERRTQIVIRSTE